MIEFKLNDALVYNGVKDTIISFIISETGSTIIVLNKKVILGLDSLMPIDTKPAETLEEFKLFLNSISSDNGEEDSNALHINTNRII